MGYHQGYWHSVASRIADHYSLKSGDKVLDIGCEGFLLYDMLKLVQVCRFWFRYFGICHSNAKDELNQICLEVVQLNYLSKKTNLTVFR